MDNILESIEIYKGIPLKLNSNKRNIYYDICNFIHSIYNKQNDIAKENIENFYEYKFDYKLNNLKLITSYNERVSLAFNNKKNWHRGFNIYGKYIIKIFIDNWGIGIEAYKSDLDKVIFHTRNGNNKETISANDLYLLARMNGDIDEDCDEISSIITFNDIHIIFNTTWFDNIIDIDITYENME